jgi:hypothetical protein
VCGVAAIFFLKVTTQICFEKMKHKYEKHYIYSTGKSIPLQVWRSPEGSRRLRLPDFKTVGT